MNNRERLNELNTIIEECEVYNRICGKINFDLQCCVPEEGMEQAGSDIAVLSKHI